MIQDKKYTITDDDGAEFELTPRDMADFHRQRRGFPSILFLGEIAGEGQAGGRYVSEMAKQLERVIIDDIGEEPYFRLMDVLLGVNE
tara:strand:+ start:8686 stop:8946 length:261 start_codon:yes stop_codon:yes gene_type:complete